MRATLKRSLGEGGAFFGDSHGDDNLHTVLAAMVDGAGERHSVAVASPSAAVIMTVVVDRPTRLQSLFTKVGTTGTAGTSTVIVNKNGSPVSGVTLSTGNAEADGTSKEIASDAFGDVDLDPGDVVTVEVTAAATGVADLDAVVRLNPIKVEA